jgi:hypothetical protein
VSISLTGTVARPFAWDDHVEQLAYEPERIDLVIVFPSRKAEEFGTRLLGPWQSPSPA